jgi:chromate transport protein ChrA
VAHRGFTRLWHSPQSCLAAAGVRSLPESLPPSVLSTLSGVNAAAVGMIALAAYQLALSSITDGATQLVFLGTAALSLLHSASWVSVGGGESSRGSLPPSGC